jgi:DNA-binding protein HU-beta/integration host factor subunit beta
MANVTKKEIVERVSERTGLSQVDTKLVVETFLDSVAISLQKGNNIEIRGFGRFKIKEQAAHTARNPRTNKEVQVDAKYKPLFEASNKLRDFVNRKILG